MLCFIQQSPYGLIKPSVPQKNNLTSMKYRSVVERKAYLGNKELAGKEKPGKTWYNY